MSVELSQLVVPSDRIRIDGGIIRTGRAASVADSTEYAEWSCHPHCFTRHVVVLLGSLLAVAAATVVARSWTKHQDAANVPPTIAFVGNSMLYYNDCPRLVEILLHRMYKTNGTIGDDQRLQDSCLRGGANLASVWEDGNGMQSRFGESGLALAATVAGESGDPTHNIEAMDIGAPTVQSLLQHPPLISTASASKRWTFVVLQDHEEYVTSLEKRQTTMDALKRHYLPTLLEQKANHGDGTVVLFLETFPYKTARLRETLGLGSFDEFTNHIVNGNSLYANLVDVQFEMTARVIPMAKAVQALGNTDFALWERLYHGNDGIHPSPHGTYLQACLIVIMATGRTPPAWDDALLQEWRRRARHWADDPLPTPSEGMALRQLAYRVFLTSKSG